MAREWGIWAKTAVTDVTIVDMKVNTRSVIGDQNRSRYAAGAPDGAGYAVLYGWFVNSVFRAAARQQSIFSELSGCALATAKQLRAWVRDAPVRAAQHCARQQ